jgi:predicted RNA-binding protein with PUA-like domain
MELLFVCSAENWDICEEKGILGVKSEGEIRSAVYENIIKAINAGDLIAVYVKNPFSRVIGIYRAKSSYYVDHSKVWPDGEYAIRVEIEKYSDCNVPFNELIAKGIKLASNKKLNQSIQLHTEIVKLEEGSISKLCNEF